MRDRPTDPLKNSARGHRWRPRAFVSPVAGSVRRRRGTVLKKPRATQTTRTSESPENARLARWHAPCDDGAVLAVGRRGDWCGQNSTVGSSHVLTWPEPRHRERGLERAQHHKTRARLWSPSPSFD